MINIMLDIKAKHWRRTNRIDVPSGRNKCRYNSAMQSQNIVFDYFTSEEILLFGFSEYNRCHLPCDTLSNRMADLGNKAETYKQHPSNAGPTL